MQPNSDAIAANGWFQQQQALAGGGPRVSSQFLLGSYRTWGLRMNDSYSEPIILKTLQAGWNLNASMSFHMSHGGTNFGFWNGNNSPYPVTTSYDSYAPISEGGDTTELFLAIRNFIGKIPNWPNPPTTIPSLLPRTSYTDITLIPADTIIGFIKASEPKCWQTESQPLTAEDINQGYGLVYYQATVSQCGQLNITQYSDDAYVFLNGQFVGIQGLVLLNDNVMTAWKSCQTPFGTSSLNTVTNYESIQDIHQPAVFSGILNLQNEPMDTYIDTRGWGKGFITVNQYNIGRYWSTEGPQQTLYLPSDYLRKGTHNSCALKFSKIPVFDY